MSGPAKAKTYEFLKICMVLERRREKPNERENQMDKNPLRRHCSSNIITNAAMTSSITLS